MKARYVVALSAGAFLIGAAACILIVEKIRSEDEIHHSVTAGIYVGLAAASIPGCFYRPISRYRISLFMIIALALCRAAHVLIPTCAPASQIIRVAFYSLSYVVECILLIEIPNEYFELPPNPTAEQMANFLSKQNSSPRSSRVVPLSESSEQPFPSQAEYYHIDDPSLVPSYPSFPDLFPSLDSSFSTKIRSSKKTTSSQRLLQRKEMEKREKGGGEIRRLEKAMIVGIITCAVMEVILLVLRKYLPSSQGGNFDYTFAINLCLIGATSFFPIVLVPLQILKVKKLVEDGAELVSCNHSHGLSFLLLTGSFAIHFVLACGFALGNGFIEDAAVLGVDIILVALPLGFHLFNVTKSASRSFVCNIKARTKVMSYMIAISVHVMMVVILLHRTAPCSTPYWPMTECCQNATSHSPSPSPTLSLSPSPSPTLSPLSPPSTLSKLSSAAAIIATIDFLILLSGSLSPILQLLYQTAMRQSVHNLHLHRIIAISGISFTILHVILATRAQRPSDVPHTVFGSIAAFLFVLAGAGGAIVAKFRYLLRPAFYRFLSSLHIPCSFLGMALLFVHQFDESKVLENRLFVAFILSCLICLILHSSFLIFHPLHSAQLDLFESEYGPKRSKFLFLVVHFHKPCPPGAFFLLYSASDSHLNYFHARPIHAFSSKNRRLTFLVESASDNGRTLLFSHHLAHGKAESIYLQGPFVDGTVSAFMDYVQSTPADIDVYLCGWNSGFSKVFSILESLKEIWPSTNIRKISCMFNIIPDKEVSNRVHTTINRLVSDWKSTIPVTIVESTNTDLRNIQIMSEQVHFSTKASTIDFFRESARVSDTHSFQVLPFSSSSGTSSASASFHHLLDAQLALADPSPITPQHTRDSPSPSPSSPSSSPPLPPHSHLTPPLPLRTRARWVVMRDAQDFSDVNPASPSIANAFRNRVLYFCGNDFQPKMFRGWKYFVETL